MLRFVYIITILYITFLSVDKGSVSYCLPEKSGPLPVFVNSLVGTLPSLFVYIFAHVYFYIKTTELSSWNRERIMHRAQNIYLFVL